MVRTPIVLVRLTLVLVGGVSLLASGAPQGAQAPPAPRQSGRQAVTMDVERARRLYVPTDPAFQSLGTDFKRHVEERLDTEKR